MFSKDVEHQVRRWTIYGQEDRPTTMFCSLSGSPSQLVHMCTGTGLLPLLHFTMFDIFTIKPNVRYTSKSCWTTIKINTDNSLSLKFIWFLKFLMDWNGCTLLYLIPAGFIAPHRFKFQSKLSYLAIYFLNDGRNLVQATSSRSVNWRVLVNTWTKTSLRLVAFLKLPSSNSSQLRTSSCQHS